MDKSYWDKHTEIILYCSLVHRWFYISDLALDAPEIGAGENTLRFKFLEDNSFFDTEIDYDAFGKSLGSIWTTFSWTEYWRIGTKHWVTMEKISDLLINATDMSLKGWGFNHKASD
jgi:hypothetical protein